MKNSYKAVLGLAAVATAVAMPSAVMANTIVLTQNTNSYAVGGEFTAVTGASQSFLGNGYVNGVTAINGGFETFCVETGVDFTPGTTYNYSTSTTTSVGQALTLGAAYLYYEFATGNLSGYDYSGANRQADAGELQAAIWYLMGKQTYPGFTTTGDSFYNLALTVLGGAANANSDNNGEYGVEILNLTVASGDDKGDAAQNQLVLTGTPSPNGSPVPDGGTTVLLLGTALSGLALVKRKLTA